MVGSVVIIPKSMPHIVTEKLLMTNGGSMHNRLIPTIMHSIPWRAVRIVVTVSIPPFVITRPQNNCYNVWHLYWILTVWTKVWRRWPIYSILPWHQNHNNAEHKHHRPIIMTRRMVERIPRHVIVIVNWVATMSIHHLKNGSPIQMCTTIWSNEIIGISNCINGPKRWVWFVVPICKKKKKRNETKNTPPPKKPNMIW